MLSDFFTRALLAGLGLAAVAGPLGAMLLWRRMAYFSDATSHGAVLGVALALALSLPPIIGVFATAALLGMAVGTLSRRGHGSDTALIVIAYASLATGLVALSLTGQGSVSVEALLFGDILATGRGDLAVIYGGSAVALALLIWRWQGLLLSTLSEDLALADGVNPDHERLVLTLCLAVVVAIALQVVGALLVGAMLVIPAAAARGLVRSPEAMAALAAGLGAASVLLGLTLSLRIDSPAGPSIVTVAAALFVVTLPFRKS